MPTKYNRKRNNTANTSFLRPNTVASPNGQINKLLQADDKPEEVEVKCQSLINDLLHQNSPLAMSVELLYLYGVRISESLSFSSSDITRTGAVKISAKKGSSDRICQLVQSVTMALEWRNKKCFPLLGYNRQYVWRLFKSKGIEIQLSNQTNKRVTHAFRHIRISATQEQFKDINQTQLHYGHKSQNSTKKYTDIKKKTFGNI
jgi:site-specific recombinase XerD